MDLIKSFVLHHRINDFTGDYWLYIDILTKVIPLPAFNGPEGAYTIVAFSLPSNQSSTVQVNQMHYNAWLRTGLRLAKAGQEATDPMIGMERSRSFASPMPTSKWATFTLSVRPSTF